jgi:membrane-associated protease RseP (regulator of RpoE activity)
VSSNATFFDFAETPPRHRYWLHLLLLLLTLLTTSVVGAGLAEAFAEGRPIRVEDVYRYDLVWRDPIYLIQGLPFSITLLAVLLAHELGHFLTARYYSVDASLPYFLPVPTPLGTFGAFIRIRSAILSKRVLFDVAIGGPIAGFVALLVPLVVGISLSKVVPQVAIRGDFVFGAPLLIKGLTKLQFPGVPLNDIYLHPMARGAWVGILATAVNLFPIGQLDGGHIVYSFLGDRTKYLSWVLVAALLPMGFYASRSWWTWAALLLLFGMKHPSLVDPTPLGPGRAKLAIFALVILILCFTSSPI